MMDAPESALISLECPECGQQFSPDQLQTICPACVSPLLARYDMERVRTQLTPEAVSRRTRGLWRWAEILPVRSPDYRISLGEGDTPLLRLSHLAGELELTELYVKDESFNPTGTFKARGLCLAVARASELGVREFVIPTAGNAGGALAAYAARAGAQAYVYMPEDAPHVNQVEVQELGANLKTVPGLIGDAGRAAKADSAGTNWFDVSTFKEPYRVEGKKTMGLELAEHFGWELPDVVIYPTGGGTGLVGMWKAFDELESLGWTSDKRPRMVSVQASGCAPVVRAVDAHTERIEPWVNAHTLAAGLRVPAPFADRLILRAIYQSDGTAIAVSDEQITDAQHELAEKEGIFPAPEGAATLAGLRLLIDQGWIRPDERVVLFNTGTGLKYIYA